MGDTKPGKDGIYRDSNDKPYKDVFGEPIKHNHSPVTTLPMRLEEIDDPDVLALILHNHVKTMVAEVEIGEFSRSGEDFETQCYNTLKILEIFLNVLHQGGLAYDPEYEWIGPPR